MKNSIASMAAREGDCQYRYLARMREDGGDERADARRGTGTNDSAA